MEDRAHRRRSTVATVRRRQVSKAKQRAEQEETFFTGEDAFTSVSEEDGLWNWALVGPDPASLPLSGGGSDSLEEMRESLGNHAHSFGLLRMTFGVEPDTITKYIFIHASDEADSGNFSRMERGQAAAMEPQMEAAIRKFAAYSAKVVLRSKDECTIENIIEKLRSVVGHLEQGLITAEHFQAAVDCYNQQHPEKQKKQKQKKQHAQIIQQNLAVPRAADAVQEADAPEQTTVEKTRQRKKLKLFGKGDVCEVFSVKHGKWYLDAEITETTDESCYLDGFRVVAGSMKVVYDNGTRFKWVAPHEMEELVRESSRPRPAEPLVGELTKEQHFWFLTHWTKMYFELQKGFLQWWSTKEEAGNGAKPAGSVYLLGLQQQDDDASFKLRTDSSEGAVHSFQADSAQDVQKWVEALWVHAGYCEEVCEFYEAKLGGVMVRKELMNVMMHRELVSMSDRRKSRPAVKIGGASANQTAGA